MTTTLEAAAMVVKALKRAQRDLPEFNLGLIVLYRGDRPVGWIERDGSIHQVPVKRRPPS